MRQLEQELRRVEHAWRRHALSPNLLLDAAPPDGINQLWVGDITYVPLLGGDFLYLALLMESCFGTLKTELEMKPYEDDGLARKEVAAYIRY